MPKRCPSPSSAHDQARYPRLARWPFLLAAALSLLLSLPAFEVGFSLDDYYLLALIEGWYEIELPPLNLYTSFMEAPNMPWWHSPETRITFWRPLSSALLRLDHALFGRWAAGWQVHGLLWLAAFLAVGGALFRRLPRRLAILAFFFLALDEAHAMTSGVIANRHAMVAATLGFCGVWAHLRWREDGWRPGLPVSLVAFAASLLAGETALAVLAYVLAFECMAAGPVARRLKAILPAAVLAVVYVLVYKALDYGPRGSSFYLDPLGEPGAYVTGLLAHIPALLSGALTGFPARLWGLPEFRLPLVVVGTVAGLALLAGLAWCRRRIGEAECRAVSAWGLGSLLSFLPVAAAPPSERQLLVPVVGLSVVLAAFFVTAWRQWRQDGPRAARWGAAALVVFLIAAHLMMAPLGRVLQLRGMARLGAAIEDVAHALPAASPQRRDLVLINAPDFFVMLYVPLVWEYGHRPGGISWNLLSGSSHDLRVWREGERTLIAEPVEGTFLTGEMETLLRPPGEEVTSGQILEGPVLKVEVLDMEATGPRRLAFHFERPLEDPALVFYVWREGELVAVTPPREGEVLAVPAAPGLLGLL